MKVLKTVALIVGGLVALLLVAVFIVLQWPQIILRPGVMNSAGSFINSKLENMKLSWQNPRARVDTLGILSNRVSLSLQKPCFQQAKSVDACFESAELTFAYDFSRIQPLITELGPVDLKDGVVDIVLSDTGEEKKESEAEFDIDSLIPDWLKNAQLKPIQVDVRRWSVSHLSLPSPAYGELQLEVQPENQLSTLLTLSHNIDSGELAHEGDLKLELLSSSNRIKGPWTASLTSHVNTDQQGRVLLRANLEQTGEGEDFTYAGSVDLKRDELSGLMDFNGEVHSSEILLNLNGDILLSAALGPLRQPRISLRQCQNQLRPSEDRNEDWRLQTNCPIQIGSEDRRLNQLVSSGPTNRPTKRSPALRAPASASRAQNLQPRLSEAADLASFILQADLLSIGGIGTENKIQGELSLHPESILPPMVRTDGHASVELSLLPNDLSTLEIPSSDYYLLVEVPRFQNVVSRLSETPFAIPAPFHELKGPVSIRLKNAPGGDTQSAVATITTRLASKHQKLHTDSKVDISIDEPALQNEALKIKANADVLLSDVTVALPPSLTETGVGFPDGRIKTDEPPLNVAEVNEETNEKSAVELLYNLHVRTKRPAELLSPASPEPIPFSVDITLGSDQPLDGEVRLGDFPIDVLGINRAVEGGAIAVQLNEFKQGMTGYLEFQDSAQPVEFSFADLLGITSLEFDPQQEVPIGQAALAFLSGYPVNIVVSDITKPNEQPGHLQGDTAGPEFRYRY